MCERKIYFWKMWGENMNHESTNLGKKQKCNAKYMHERIFYSQ